MIVGVRCVKKSPKKTLKKTLKKNTSLVRHPITTGVPRVSSVASFNTVSEYQLQVRGRDFAIDPLFFNRALNCLVAIEHKIDEFQPERLGQLEFSLEASARRREPESPSGEETLAIQAA